MPTWLLVERMRLRMQRIEGDAGRTRQPAGQQRRLVELAAQQAQPAERHRHDDIGARQQLAPGLGQPARQQRAGIVAVGILSWCTSVRMAPL
jgi:hypothetical protein